MITVSDSKDVDGTDDTAVDATITVTITVRDDTTQNAAPTFTGPNTRSIRADTTVGSPVGSPVTATDPEGDTLTYAITSGNTALFAIDTSNGQLTYTERRTDVH
jgi:hypothetical protein